MGSFVLWVDVRVGWGGDGLHQSNIPRFLVQNIPMNLRKAEIVCASGLHDFRSFISIAQKETLHI